MRLQKLSWCPPFAKSDEGIEIAFLHLHGNIPLVKSQSELTPMQKLFLNVSIKKLTEISTNSKESDTDKTLKEAYERRKKK